MSTDNTTPRDPLSALHQMLSRHIIPPAAIEKTKPCSEQDLEPSDQPLEDYCDKELASFVTKTPKRAKDKTEAQEAYHILLDRLANGTAVLSKEDVEALYAHAKNLDLVCWRQDVGEDLLYNLVMEQEKPDEWILKEAYRELHRRTQNKEMLKDPEKRCRFYLKATYLNFVGARDEANKHISSYLREGFKADPFSFKDASEHYKNVKDLIDNYFDPLVKVVAEYHCQPLSGKEEERAYQSYLRLRRNCALLASREMMKAYQGMAYGFTENEEMNALSFLVEPVEDFAINAERLYPRPDSSERRTVPASVFVAMQLSQTTVDMINRWKDLPTPSHIFVLVEYLAARTGVLHYPLPREGTPHLIEGLREIVAPFLGAAPSVQPVRPVVLDQADQVGRPLAPRGS